MKINIITNLFFMILVTANNIQSLSTNQNTEYINLFEENQNSSEFSDYCEEGLYGPECNKNCSCTSKISNSNKCAKFSGLCTDCKFGHFGNKCENICYPNCKYNFCCVFNDKNFFDKSKKLSLEIKNSKISIKLNNTIYILAIDYNVGHTITLFKNTNNTNDECPSISKVDITLEGENEPIKYSYTDFETEGLLYQNQEVIFNNNDKINIDVSLANKLKCNFENNNEKYENVNGIIGVGLVNSLSQNLFNNDKTSYNIVSYKVNNNDVSILFGYLFDDEIQYLDKLSSCNITKTPINNKNFVYGNISCQIEAIHTSYDKDALKLNNSYITFNLNENNSYFILKNDTIYYNYIKNSYLSGKISGVIENNDKTNFCYSTSKINKLYELGFIFNKYFYLFSADKFFTADKNNGCSEDNSKFKIEFSNVENSIVVLGKDFLKDMIFTVDNDEGKIYFYTRNRQYFTGNIKDEIEENDNKKEMSALEKTIISVATIFAGHVVFFMIYFIRKRRKNKNQSKYLF